MNNATKDRCHECAKSNKSNKKTCIVAPSKKGNYKTINNKEDALEKDIVPCGTEQDDSEMIVGTPENNAIHQCCIRNVTGKSCHPENKINQNDNMVVIQIPIKYLNSVKPKLKDAKENKNQLQVLNPHMSIEWTRANDVEVHAFNNWLWMKMTFLINCNIASTMIETTNATIGLKGVIAFNKL